MTKMKEEAPTVTAAAIGEWLFKKIREASPRHYYQTHAVMHIRTSFGEEWSYKNQNGNWAISKEVLKEFGKLKETDLNIQWDSGSQAWQRLTDEKLQHLLERKAIQKQRTEERALLKAEQEKKA